MAEQSLSNQLLKLTVQYSREQFSFMILCCVLPSIQTSVVVVFAVGAWSFTLANIETTVDRTSTQLTAMDSLSFHAMTRFSFYTEQLLVFGGGDIQGEQNCCSSTVLCSFTFLAVQELSWFACCVSQAQRIGCGRSTSQAAFGRCSLIKRYALLWARLFLLA